MENRSLFSPGRLWRWLCLLTVFSGLWVLPAVAEKRPPRVLIINSYYPGYLWSDNEQSGLIKQLRQRYSDINPSIEYLDTKRFPTEGHLLFMKDYLAGKYNGRKFDLVITLDNPALEMALRYRQELFPGTPLVFAGVNDFHPSMLAGQEKVTGVAEVLNIANTLKTMLALHPETKEVFVIHDYTATGLATRREMEALLPDFQSRVHIKFAPPGSLEEIINQIKALPAKSLGLILSFATDKTGQTFTPDKIARLLTSGIDIPVYAVHEVRLGHGIVGGILLGGKEQGRQAGDVALRVLAGEDPAKIPVEIKSTAQPMFDYKQLARFDIPLSALPVGSIIINRPESLYHKHRTLVWGILFVIAILSLMVVCLTVTIMRRRQAEAALRESEVRNRTILKTAMDGFWRTDLQGRLLEVNEGYCRMSGYSEEELLAMSVSDLEAKETPADIAAHTQKVMAQGEERFETRHRRKDGSVIMVEVSVKYGSTAEDQVVAFLRDITDRKRAEEALKEIERVKSELLDKLNEAQHVAAIGSWEWDLQTNNVWWSDETYQIFGVTPQDFVPDFEANGKFIHPDDFDSYLKLFEHSFQTGEPLVFDCRLVTNDGLLKYANARGKIIYDDSGRPIRFIGTVMDVTDRKQAEETIRESEERLRLAQQVANIGTFEWNIQTGVNIWTPELEAMHGLPPGGFAGTQQAWENLVYPDDRTEALRRVESSLLVDESVEGEWRVVWPDGSVHWLTGRWQVFKDESGKPLRVTGVNMDITERKQLEEQFLQAQKMEAVGTLAGGIAHDFNNILMAIVGNIGLAMLEGKIDPGVQDRLVQAEAACQRAQALSQQLLTFAKGGSPIKKLFSVAELLTQSTTFAGNGFPVKCETTFSENLWWIEADPGQIGQVVLNLTINAIQAMPTGGTIKVWAENLTLGTESGLPLSAGRYIKISVRDQGMGIPAEHLPRIFDPYFTTKQKGSGLGLASTYAIINKHHGHIAVESKPGEGTTFHIYLPAVE